MAPSGASGLKLAKIDLRYDYVAKPVGRANNCWRG